MKKKIIFIILGVILFFGILFLTYSQIYKYQTKKEEQNQQSQQNDGDGNVSETQGFEAIFENKLDNKDYTNENIQKTVGNEALVYTALSKKEVIENKYNLNLNFPIININCDAARKFNNQTQELFVEKANVIMQKEGAYNIYTLDYMAYINENILSVILKSTLKEDNNSQRMIIQTYNMDLETLEEVNFKNLMEKKSIQEKDIEQKLRGYNN
ncbi:MAG: hypothetical protein Q4G05_00475 [Clostridia bacterium]|nr:hypothetical protein [Clostridia bacterium]